MTLIVLCRSRSFRASKTRSFHTISDISCTKYTLLTKKNGEGEGGKGGGGGCGGRGKGKMRSTKCVCYQIEASICCYKKGSEPYEDYCASYLNRQTYEEQMDGEDSKLRKK